MVQNIKKGLILSLLLSCLFSVDAIFSQKINQFDENNKRTGVWKKYHSNNRIRYIGQFKNGKEFGTFRFYDITTTKHPVVIKKYSTKSDTAFVQFFTLKGNLRSSGKMIQKNRVGKWIYLFENGKKFSEEFYLNGKLEGNLKNYYKNGKITEHIVYKNGLKHGLMKLYSDEGILLEEVNYLNGKANGLAKYFDLKGNIKEKGIYKNGKRLGKWEFFMDGEIVSKKEKKKQNKYKKNKR